MIDVRTQVRQMFLIIYIISLFFFFFQIVLRSTHTWRPFSAAIFPAPHRTGSETTTVARVGKAPRARWWGTASTLPLCRRTKRAIVHAHTHTRTRAHATHIHLRFRDVRGRASLPSLFTSLGHTQPSLRHRGALQRNDTKAGERRSPRKASVSQRRRCPLPRLPRRFPHRRLRRRASSS